MSATDEFIFIFGINIPLKIYLGEKKTLKAT